MAQQVISRRVLAQGVAWAAPAVVIGTAAPAFADSQVRGLDGWVLLKQFCDSVQCESGVCYGDQGRLEIDGTGALPDRGIWVHPVESASITPEDAKITFYFPTGRLTGEFAAVVASDWSVPVVDPSASPRAGFTAYTTKYSGAWTYIASSQMMVADTVPYFRTVIAESCPDEIPAFAVRSVVVDGEALVHERNATLSGMNGPAAQSSSRRSALTSDDGESVAIARV